MSQARRNPTQIWWILWIMFCTTVVMMNQILGPAAAHSKEILPDSNAWMIAGAAPILAATLIRWLLLPRQVIPIKAFRLFIIGIALAESVTFYGIFLFPSHKNDLVMASLFGIIQFAPFFASRFSSWGSQPPTR
jgi:hypothetical protein